MCLLAVFIIVYFSLWKGIKSSGKVCVFFCYHDQKHFSFNFSIWSLYFFHSFVPVSRQFGSQQPCHTLSFLFYWFGEWHLMVQWMEYGITFTLSGINCMKLMWVSLYLFLHIFLPLSLSLLSSFFWHNSNLQLTSFLSFPFHFLEKII